MADPADAWDEDHAHLAELRHHLRVVTGAARQARGREPAGGRRPFDRALDFWRGQRGWIATQIRDLDRRLRLGGDLTRAGADVRGDLANLLRSTDREARS